jgi:NADH-quinone oxidoreductase subunit D
LGPNLRAAGVDYDVRVAQPLALTKILILIPVGKSGDTYDRFCVRNAEVCKRYRQALEKNARRK